MEENSRNYNSSLKTFTRIACEQSFNGNDCEIALIAAKSPQVWRVVRTLFCWRPMEAKQKSCANPCQTADLQRIAGIASKRNYSRNLLSLT
ncbi:hypothetical protein CHX27_11405 [Flavobacterium aurantiibacter]|uniref:Uncharacterized protein n=1 Tax=Flavobacterium aurantiibacter TaxID=2023067 RepID=A0A255ZN53_9FLAO|nr:hypothetical protein CHX27_12520 [Flavobacterium aurantiibacter]OYQ42896.1 hypothetical protein CHX27_11405 [Flavobacterium aurantiibacter]